MKQLYDRITMKLALWLLDGRETPAHRALAMDRSLYIIDNEWLQEENERLIKKLERTRKKSPTMKKKPR